MSSQSSTKHSRKLEGKRVAILATDGFEQVELTGPKANLEQAGAKVEVISLQEGDIRGWDKADWGDRVKVDQVVTRVKPASYDALVLPGGQINPDKLRMDRNAVDFIREFVESGKPVAAICHGPWGLIEAGVVKGRTMTSWPSVQTDLRNAGANWVDQEVVESGNIITSRRPGDITAFSNKLIEALSREQPMARAS